MSIPAENLPGFGGASARTARGQGLIEPVRLMNNITRGQLAFILQEAAIDAEKLIQGNIARSRVTTLMSAMQGVNALSQEMWGDIHRLIEEGVTDAAMMAADHQLIREISMGLPTSDRIIRQYSERMYFNAIQSANDIISRHTNGFTLSQRVYRNSQANVLLVGRIVDRGLALQMSAREIASEVRGLIDPRTPGGISYAAMRLARTEINNAHHDTTIRMTQDRPWVTGYKWNLSGSHPKPDICDTYAHRNGGVFSKRDVPSKPHPQCFCFITVEQESREEFLRKLQSQNRKSYFPEESLPQSNAALNPASGNLDLDGDESPFFGKVGNEDWVTDARVADNLISDDYLNDPRFVDETLYLDEMYAGQRKVSARAVNGIKSSDFDFDVINYDEPTIVVRAHGMDVMVDGHHRAMAAAQRGRKTVRSLTIDISDELTDTEWMQLLKVGDGVRPRKRRPSKKDGTTPRA